MERPYLTNTEIIRNEENIGVDKIMKTRNSNNNLFSDCDVHKSAHDGELLTGYSLWNSGLCDGSTETLYQS